MFYNVVLQLLSVSLGLLNGVLAADAQLEPLFQLQPGAVGVSGCDAHASNLKLGYTEAIKLAEQAIVSLNDLKKPQPHDGEDELSLSPQEEKDQKEWARQARIAKAMFAIDTDPNHGVVAGDSATRLDFAIATFQSVTENAYKNPVPDDLTHLTLCTPEGIAYLKPGEQDPGGSGPIDAAKYPDGVMVTSPAPPGFPDGFMWHASRGTKDPQALYCLGANGIENVQAEALPDSDIVIWCRFGLGFPATLSTTYSQGAGLPDTLSVIWIHELIHIWSGDAPGRKGFVIDEAVGRQDQSSGFTFQQPNTRCYGYTECAELAKLVPAKTTNNADSYTLFALGVWLKDWDWATPANGGKAAPF